MRTLRLYAAALVMGVWSLLVLVGVTDVSAPFVALRLATLAAGLAFSLRESSRINGERKRRRDR